MRKVMFFITLLGVLACSKDKLDGVYKKSEQPPLPPDEFDCEYILAGIPVDIFSMLDNPDDPEEEINDRHLYRVAKALSRFTCYSGDFQNSFLSVAFDRYGDGFLELEVEDLANADPVFHQLLQNEFNAEGLDWHSVANHIQWKGIDYKIIVYLENAPVADWELSPYIGIGTDLDVPDSIGDFIPAFYNRCEEEPFDPDELMIGKVDPLGVSDPEPIPYDAECLRNPLLIVQLGWAKSKKALDLGDPDPYTGTPKDTVIDGVQSPPGPGCAYAQDYYLILGGIAGLRFERSKRSEYNLELMSIAVPGGPKDGFFPSDSRREHLRKIHKNDKWDIVGFNHEYVSGLNYNYFPIGPIGSLPDEHCYSVTYEYDWYAKNRNITFWHFNGVQPKLRLRRKGDHEHYQIMNFTPADWCDGLVKEFTNPHGRSYVRAKN